MFDYIVGFFSDTDNSNEINKPVSFLKRIGLNRCLRYQTVALDPLSKETGNIPNLLLGVGTDPRVLSVSTER